jgi:TolB-like protein
MQFVFGDYVLDPDRRELSRGPKPIALGPQVFDLLLYLVQHHERVVSKDELLDAVWNGRIVSESTLSSHISAVRKALADNGGEQRLLRTIARKGFRFVGDIRETPSTKSTHPANAEPTATGDGAAPPGLTLPDKPSIAVLPFVNMSGDPEQAYFADGMVEEIITALSRIRWLFVIARNSSFTYRGRVVDVKQVGRELGVRYVVEGSVRKSRGRVRITGQLIDAVTGLHLWADHFDGSLEDVFDLQDKVALAVAGVIEPALQVAEMRRSAARQTTDLTAYDFYLRALAAYFPVTRKSILGALELLRQAIAADPHFGPALSWAGVCHMRAFRDGWAAEPETSRRNAVDCARQALQVGENDPAILANAAFALANSGEDIGAMLGLINRALRLNPSFARGWYLSGILRLWAGETDLAIKHIQTSLRLNPREPMGTPLSALGQAYFFKRQFDESAASLLLSIQDHPGFPTTYRFLAACYAHMGRLDEARAIVARLRAISPLVKPSAYHWQNPEDRGSPPFGPPAGCRRGELSGACRRMSAAQRTLSCVISFAERGLLPAYLACVEAANLPGDRLRHSAACIRFIGLKFERLPAVNHDASNKSIRPRRPTHRLLQYRHADQHHKER